LVNGIARGNDVHGFYTKSARDTWVLENGFETARDALGVSAQAARPIGARKAYRLLGRADGFAMAVANGLIRHDRDTGGGIRTLLSAEKGRLAGRGVGPSGPAASTRSPKAMIWRWQRHPRGEPGKRIETWRGKIMKKCIQKSIRFVGGFVAAFFDEYGTLEQRDAVIGFAERIAGRGGSTHNGFDVAMDNILSPIRHLRKRRPAVRSAAEVEFDFESAPWAK
jgi:hypothetical protein